MKISSISFKNLLSFGNKLTELNYDNVESILVVGTNGNGKNSAIIEPIFFNLTGRPYRDIKIAQLINSKNKKHLETTGIYFSSTGTKVTIVRNRKPDLFELYINDVKQDQEGSKDFQKRIETILEFSPKNLEKLFLISSTSYKPFLSSTPDEKRKLIDQVIEIENFSRMSDSIKKDRSIEKERFKEIEFQIDKLKSNIDLIEDFNKKIDEHSDNQDEEDYDIKLEAIKIEAIKLKKQKQSQQEKLDEIVLSTNDLIQKDLKQSKAINALSLSIEKRQSSVDENKKRLDDERSKLCESNACSKCGYEVSKEKLEELTWNNEKEILQNESGDFDLQNERSKLDIYVKKNEKIKDCINLNQKQIQNMSDLVRKHTDKQHEMKIVYVGIQNKKDASETALRTSNIKKDPSDLIKELNDQYEEKIKCSNHMIVIETSLKLLGEKYLRAHMIQRYLPEINKSLRKYLEVFGLPFMITLDNEFKEVIHSREYSSLNYNNLSEGEKKRIDLSLVFSFFDICKLRSKQSSNILVLDEVADSSIDNEAINGLGHIINLLKQDGISSIIISHNDNVKESIDFDKCLEINKKSGFSQIKEI